MSERIVVVIVDDGGGDSSSEVFLGDALTSPEQQAIEFLKSIEKDAFDE